ncbi:MAG: hypothetical protein WDZ35_09310 [Crocinitomicaceae bacterium]
MSSFKIYGILLLFFFFLPLCSLSQKVDSSSQKIALFPTEHGAKTWKLLLGLDARRSFFSGVPIKINGLKLGAEYKGVHRFGFGFYWLKRDVSMTDFVVERDDAAEDTEVRFSLGYSSLFYERVFLKTRWWEVAFPVHLGGGRVSATYKDTIGAFQPLLQHPFSTLTLSTQLKFYPLEWLAIRVSGGYRTTFNTQKEVKTAFNRPFYGFGLSINVITLYHVIFSSSKNKENEEEVFPEENY